MLDQQLLKRWRIIVKGTLIVAAPLLGLALFVYFDVIRELENLSIEKRRAIAATAARVLDEKLQGEISFGKAYTTRYLLVEGCIKGDEKEMARHLQNLVETSRHIELAAIASPSGILMASYPALPELLGQDLSHRDWYRGVSRAWTPYISEFFPKAALPHSNVFIIAVPIRAEDRRIIGILLTQPKRDFIEKALDGISQSGIIYLVDSHGTIIYHPGLSGDELLNISHTSVVRKVMQGFNGFEKGTNPLTGETVISAYHPVDSSGWGIVTERPLGEVLAPVRDVAHGIYFFTAVMLLIGAWFAYRRSTLIYQLERTSDELLKSYEKLRIANDGVEAMNLELQTMNEESRSVNEELLMQQQELAESNRRLELVSRTKSDFLANMSHELRTPLNSVIGFSEVLLDRLFGPINDKQQEYLKNIWSSGKYLLALINDILDLAKVESGKMELELSTFSLSETLEASLTMLQEKALKGRVDLRLELAPEADVEIVADQRKIKQILFNLLSNAVKFTPAGGSVTVRARPVAVNSIEIAVADTGRGIKEEDMGKLFQTFTQLESAYTKEFEGTGLGLALTKMLVKLHGGRIWAESEYGKGSRFGFVLPLRQMADTGVPAAQESHSTVGSGRTVLLIEDEPLALALLENTLQSKGYRVVKASDGGEGLEMARRHLPDLIVLDLMLPGMNGFDVVDRLQQEEAVAAITILVLTSMDLSATARARLAGKVWRIVEKGSLSSQEYIRLVESAIGTTVTEIAQ